MDFLENIATPQSLDHFHLLLFVLNVLLVVYVPYLAFLMGSASVAYASETRTRRHGPELYRQIASDLLTSAMQDRKAVIFMGIVPSLALVFVFSQILQGTSAMSVGLLAFSSLFLVAGAGSLAAFRFTFRFREVLESVGSKSTGPGTEAGTAASENETRQLKTGRYALLFLTVSVFLLSGALALAADPHEWSQVDNIIGLVASGAVLLKFVQLLTIAAAVTGAGVLFYLDRPEKTDEYRESVRRLGITLAVASILLQPLVVLGGAALLPKVALSGMFFGIEGASLAVFLLAGILVYGVFKEPGKGFSGAAFATMLVAVGFLMTNEQVAVHNATKDHAVILALEYQKINDAFKESLGISTAPVVTGADIYNGRCSACHLPDTRKVGPPFREVAAKYAGKREALMAFIRNPVNNRPDYPPMPNQGLRPAEIDSIASYLLRTFGPPATGTTEGQPPK